MEIQESIITKNNFETIFAKIISYVLHPLLMPSYGFILLFYTNNYISTFTPPKLKLLIIGITFVFTFVFPTLNAIILLKLKRIKSLEMENAEERVIPYISTILYFSALCYLFYYSQFPPIFYILVLGATISVLFTLIINFKWKISAHAMGIGGIIGAVIGISHRLYIDLQLIVLITLIFGGLVG